MKLAFVVVGVVLLVAAGQCGDDSDVVPGAREAPTGAGDATAVAALGLLSVKGRAAMTGYDRARFGPAWLDADRNGCDTRNDILAEHLLPVTLESNGCVVAAGSYDDPYTGSTIDYWQGDGSLVDIDHVVSLGNAWATGAFDWPIKKRAAFANDPLNLLPTDAGANRQKGDGDAATWLPANTSYRCEYVSRQVAVKAKYDLWVTPPEEAAIQRVLVPCDGQAVTPDRWGAPTEVDHNISDPSAVPATGPSGGGDPVRYDSCDEARAAGATPVRTGDPGYGTHLDGDGDGSACE
ncbi:DUF1524 domain-containing protein [Nocardioides sp. S5]|uniref:GmrSD restriction endonuclease domain-containing protein n=1 Tax=Nocardioides sp. S5 TaxID=2017486 RepID=UPI001F5CABD3|nr:DUF1524 domain-containing protein [Nocardioides sp. S5]